MAKDGKRETTDTGRIVNRHKARMLCELEEGNCPRIYVDCVKRNLDWLRSDLERLNEE